MSYKQIVVNVLPGKPYQDEALFKDKIQPFLQGNQFTVEKEIQKGEWSGWYILEPVTPPADPEVLRLIGMEIEYGLGRNINGVMLRKDTGEVVATRTVSDFRTGHQAPQP